MKLTVSHISPFLVITVIATVPGTAQPSLHSSFMVAGEKVYRDISKLKLYYYIPFDYKLATDNTGKPSFTVTQMRYTGTRSTGDEGTVKYSNFLQFKLAVDEAQQKKLATIRTALKTTIPAAELRMMPVRKFFSVLVFASAENTASVTDSVNLVKVDLAEATDENAAVNNSYWNERTVSLRLSNTDAELVENALKNNRSIMSFSYAIYSVFAEKTSDGLSITGTGKLRYQVADHFRTLINPAKDTATNTLLVKADAISLAVDINKWPALVQKIDINERVPAKYALFDVYCYDFNNELRPDLYEKKIEIKATSVAGADIITTYAFRQSRPDLYARSIRFPYAVKFDRPFYYRVTEINNDGEATATEWIQKKEWNEVLDITSPPEKITGKSARTGQ
ncbi:MAG: hypothetical protein ACT4OJ_04595 [Bacteroidota bacterium]